MKFILKRDWNVNTVFSGVKNTILIFKKGQEFLPDENSNYIIEWIGGNMSLDQEKMIHAKDEDGNLLFDLVNEESINFSISEIPDNEEDIHKRWRIQLDVTTSLKKMKDIEKFINDNVRKLL